jgi:molecular chaperone HscB
MMHPELKRPDTSNYFRFYGLEEKFDLDTTQLKTLFLEKSKQYHPDYFSHDPESQNIAVATSAYNNLAYKILANEVRRAMYLTEIKLEQTEKTAPLPAEFLMQMMELNESIDEADSVQSEPIKEEIARLQTLVLDEIRTNANAADWENTLVSVLKWKYLERLEARLV